MVTWGVVPSRHWRDGRLRLNVCIAVVSDRNGRAEASITGPRTNAILPASGALQQHKQSAVIRTIPGGPPFSGHESSNWNRPGRAGPGDLGRRRTHRIFAPSSRRWGPRRASTARMGGCGPRPGNRPRALLPDYPGADTPAPDRSCSRCVLPNPGRGARTSREMPRSSRSAWITRAARTRSRSRVIVCAIQSM